jgi:hypothetical protein
MQAGKLRFRANVEQYDGSAWQPFFADWFDFQTVSEGEDKRTYHAIGRWRAEWDQVSGLATHSESFRFVWTYGQKNGQPLVRALVIDQIMDPDNRRREVQITCHEIIEA